MRQLLRISTGLLLGCCGLAPGPLAALAAPAAPTRPAKAPAAPGGAAGPRPMSLPEQRVFSATAYASTLCLIRSGRLSHGVGMARLGQTLQQNGIDQRLLGSTSVNEATRLLQKHLRPDCLSSQLSPNELIRQLAPLVQ